MPTMHKRCIYVSPDTGIECEIWFASDSPDDHFCILHKDSISPSLAANGHNKDPYIQKRNEALLSLVEATRGMSVPESLSYLDQHIANIERVIEDEKLKVLTARAKRAEIIEGLSEEERKARQKIRTPKVQAAEKKSKSDSAAHAVGREMLAREKAIASIMKTGKTREQAIAIWEA